MNDKLKKRIKKGRPLTEKSIVEYPTLYMVAMNLSGVYEVPKKRGLRAVYQLTKDKILIGEFETIMEAARSTKIPKNSIWACCKEKQPYAGGFIWRYKNG